MEGGYRDVEQLGQGHRQAVERVQYQRWLEEAVEDPLGGDRSLREADVVEGTRTLEKSCGYHEVGFRHEDCYLAEKALHRSQTRYSR